MKMMIALEKRLQKEGLLESFNKNVADFKKRGVISWVSDVPEIDNYQRSYISLTYDLLENQIMKLQPAFAYVATAASGLEDQKFQSMIAKYQDQRT